jgi:hypothetical protein
MDGGNGSLTLAFDLDALKRLAKPDAVFSDARQWSEYVGIVSEKPTYVVTNFARKHRIRQDFFSGPQDRKRSLRNIADQFQTDRHVFVGTSDEDKDLAATVGWEYLPVEEAASAAEWELGEATTEAESESETRDDWP